MHVYGIDPSLTCTGLAKTTPDGVRLLRIPTVNDGDELTDVRRRVRYIVGQVVQFAPAECLTVIEQPYVPKGGAAAGSVIERAWLYGLIVEQMFFRGPVVAVVNTTRSAYALKGGAKKSEVLAAVRARFPGLVIRDDNQADALVLASMGARALGRPIDGALSKNQMSAHRNVRWPDMKEMQ